MDQAANYPYHITSPRYQYTWVYIVGISFSPPESQTTNMTTANLAATQNTLFCFHEVEAVPCSGLLLHISCQRCGLRQLQSTGRCPVAAQRRALGGLRGPPEAPLLPSLVPLRTADFILFACHRCKNLEQRIQHRLQHCRQSGAFP